MEQQNEDHPISSAGHRRSARTPGAENPRYLHHRESGVSRQRKNVPVERRNRSLVDILRKPSRRTVDTAGRYGTHSLFLQGNGHPVSDPRPAPDSAGGGFHFQWKSQAVSASGHHEHPGPGLRCIAGTHGIREDGYGFKHHCRTPTTSPWARTRGWRERPSARNKGGNR